MFFATSGSTRTYFDRGKTHRARPTYCKNTATNAREPKEPSPQDDSIINEDEAEQWSLSVTSVYSTFRPHGDTCPTDELDMSLADDENEESNFTTFRALLGFFKVALRLVLGDMMDRLVTEWDEDARLSVLSHDASCNMCAMSK